MLREQPGAVGSAVLPRKQCQQSATDVMCNFNVISFPFLYIFTLAVVSCSFRLSGSSDFYTVEVSKVSNDTMLNSGSPSSSCLMSDAWGIFATNCHCITEIFEVLYDDSGDSHWSSTLESSSSRGNINEKQDKLSFPIHLVIVVSCNFSCGMRCEHTGHKFQTVRPLTAVSG